MLDNRYYETETGRVYLLKLNRTRFTPLLFPNGLDKVLEFFGLRRDFRLRLERKHGPFHDETFVLVATLGNVKIYDCGAGDGVTYLN